MCLTWILGIVIVEEDFLVPLAYLYILMVAFQGTFIFLVFVVFSKAVREAYRKWCRNKVMEYDFLSKCFGDRFNNSNTTHSSKVKQCIIVQVFSFISLLFQSSRQGQDITKTSRIGSDGSICGANKFSITIAYKNKAVSFE